MEDLGLRRQRPGETAFHMRLAIVGAGWAGLAAAVKAADQGYEVSVFESAHTLGGRARRVDARQFHVTLDNGQHILLSAYTHTMALMRRLKQDPDTCFKRLTLDLHSLDGQYRLALADAPAPWHLAMGLLRARGLDWRDKWLLARAMQRLKRHHWQVRPDINLHAWLKHHCPSEHLYQWFWQPLCLAAMNTPVQEASTQLFANVLRDSLGSGRAASDVLLPTIDLSELWPEQVERVQWAHADGSLRIYRGHTVRQLQLSDMTQDAGVEVDGQHFDGLILACPPPSTRRLLDKLPAPRNRQDEVDALLACLAAFDFNPIATLTLILASPWRLPAPMLMLHENRERHHFGQWLFNWPDFRVDTQRPILQIVISDAAQASGAGTAAVLEGVVAQLQEQAGPWAPMPEVIGHSLIIEKRATFRARTDLTRPSNTTPWPNIWLAGDWTDTGYPGVLEGAVRSGQLAVRNGV